MGEKLNLPKDKMKWACLQFTPEEDLLLVSTDGVLYLIDPLTGEFKEKPVNLGLEFQQRNIVDAKLFDNTLILRNCDN